MAQEIPEQLFVGEVAQKILIEHEGKILMCRDVGSHKEWDSPGGRLHFGESPKDGLAREVKEEIGVDVVIGEPFFTGVFEPSIANKSQRSRFLVVYYGTLKDPAQPFVLAPDEIAEVRWVGKDDYMTVPTWPEFARMLRDYFSRREN